MGFEGDPALVLGDEASDQVEDGGLARTIGADKAGDAASWYRKRAVVNGDDAAETLAQVIDLEQAHGAAPTVPASLARRLAINSPREGRMPCGISRMTSRKTAEYRTR